MACRGTLSSPKKSEAASMRVTLSSVTSLVKLALEDLRTVYIHLKCLSEICLCASDMSSLPLPC